MFDPLVGPARFQAIQRPTTNCLLFSVPLPLEARPVVCLIFCLFCFLFFSFSLFFCEVALLPNGVSPSASSLGILQAVPVPLTFLAPLFSFFSFFFVTPKWNLSTPQLPISLFLLRSCVLHPPYFPRAQFLLNFSVHAAVTFSRPHCLLHLSSCKICSFSYFFLCLRGP